ncbi:MAG: hypothetical protein P3T54_00650 [Dehalogenimonas sp.]|uniref:50S ribosomal protein L2 n=1 Tax=Candidatus Dehalogenimonas loeffleri TaxID=3127115 RepID=A0ABZ2J180_9CHLR|nr:hypothetical protein [Dehalogenimonas sp.]
MKTESYVPGQATTPRPGDRVIRIHRQSSGKLSGFLHHVASLLHLGRTPRVR